MRRLELRVKHQQAEDTGRNSDEMGSLRLQGRTSLCTYRVRNLPSQNSLRQTESLLNRALLLSGASKLQIDSLAPDLERDDRLVATISFQGESSLLT